MKVDKGDIEMMGTIIQLDSDRWYAAGKELMKKDVQYRAVLKNWNIYLQRFGGEGWAVEKDGQLISFNATRFNKRTDKDGWGRYINWFIAYTRPEFRRRGYACALQLHVENLARKRGYQRVKSLIESYAGFRLHAALGHQLWGVNERNEIVVDASIDRAWTFPSGIPPMARKCLNPHLYSQAELAILLTRHPYSQSSAEIESCFQQRPLRYRWELDEPAVLPEVIA